MRLALLFVVVMSSSLFADDHRPPPALFSTPVFVTLDRQTGASTAGVELGYAQPGNSTEVERGELHAEVVAPSTGVGIYARLPFAHYAYSIVDSDTSLGDVEVGTDLRVVPMRGLDVVLHAGLGLPTAPVFFPRANDFAPLLRWQDVALCLGDGTTLRFGVSPTWRSGVVVVRADAGIDLNVSNETGSARSTQAYDIHSIAHGALGVGYVVDRFAATLEVTTTRLDGAGPQVTYTNELVHWFTSGALGFRFPVGRYAPFVAILIPIAGHADAELGVAATAGLDLALF